MTSTGSEFSEVLWIADAESESSFVLISGLLVMAAVLLVFAFRR